MGLDGCVVFKNKWFHDSRGFFVEAYKRSEFSIPAIRQTNVSVSKKNVVRGLHAQGPGSAQGKLVRVVHGDALDVVVDIRVGSPTYGLVEAYYLTPSGISVYVPAGFLHAYWAMTDDCVFHYGCTEEYDKQAEIGVTPLDTDLCLPWRGRSDLIISQKDLDLPRFKEFKSPFEVKV